MYLLKDNKYYSIVLYLSRNIYYNLYITKKYFIAIYNMDKYLKKFFNIFKMLMGRLCFSYLKICRVYQIIFFNFLS